MRSAAFIAATMARRGLLTPGPPTRVARQLNALRHWGFGLAGELRQAAARSPDQVAVLDDGGASLTYAALLTRTTQVARALSSPLTAGLPAPSVSAGDRVGILCRNSASMLATLLGVAQLGADPVLINTGLPAAQLASLAAAQNLRLIVHDDSFEGVPAALALSASALTSRTASVAPARAFHPPNPAAPSASHPPHPAAPSASHPTSTATGARAADLLPPGRPSRTIVLTSGTTGLPKGARRPTPGGFGPLCSIIDRIPLHAGARMMIAAPLFHTWGFAALQIALALRATIVLRRRFDPAAVLDDLNTHRCTALIAVPVMLQRMMELPAPPSRPPLTVVAVSGSALPGGLATDFMNRYGDILYNLYGSTEVSWASIATPADLRAAPDTAGRPPHGTTVTVRDPHGVPLPANVPGRLFVRNDMLFEGYTATVPAASPSPHGLPTGDLGHQDESGRVFVDGREDDMIVSGGENVFPSQVENLLADLPEVREVAVIGVPDDEYGRRLAAFVVLHAPGSLTEDQIRDHVRHHRARFCVPRNVVFLAELPRTTTGKVLTRQLRLPPA